MPLTRALPSKKTGHLHAARPVAARPFDHVVACLDHSALAPDVLREAAAMAETMEAEFSVLRVMEPPGQPLGSPIDPVDWGLARRSAEMELRQIAEDIGVPEWTTTDVLDGLAADCIRRKVREVGVDLVVLGTHAAGERLEYGLGSTARRVVENVTASVLTVPAGTASPATRWRHGGRVLVPLDSSPQGESVLPVALRIAERTAGELVLLHVVPSAGLTGNRPPDASDMSLREMLDRRNAEAARSYLNHVRACLPADKVRTGVRIITGADPRQALAQAIIEEKADLVVMSARGAGGHPGLPIGSTAEYLLAGASVPVLLLRTQEKLPHSRYQPAPRRPPTARTVV